MTARFLVALIVAASSTLAVSAQTPSRREPDPQAIDGPLVSVRVTHANGQRLDFGGAPRVQPSTTFEGEVVNPPLSANVWLAARTVGGPKLEGWNVLFPPARVEEQGQWSAHVDLPCVPDNAGATCEVLVFVSRHDFEHTPYEEDQLRQLSFATAGPVNVQVLATGAVAGPSVTIERVSGFLVSLAQPVKTPAGRRRRQPRPQRQASLVDGEVYARRAVGHARSHLHRRSRRLARELVDAADPGSR
jgi:hypothetical protein